MVPTTGEGLIEVTLPRDSESLREIHSRLKLFQEETSYWYTVSRRWKKSMNQEVALKPFRASITVMIFFLTDLGPVFRFIKMLSFCFLARFVERGQFKNWIWRGLNVQFQLKDRFDGTFKFEQNLCNEALSIPIKKYNRTPSSFWYQLRKSCYFLEVPDFKRKYSILMVEKRILKGI